MNWRKIYFILRWLGNWLLLIIIVTIPAWGVLHLVCSKALFTWPYLRRYAAAAFSAWLLLLLLRMFAKTKYKSSNSRSV